MEFAPLRFDFLIWTNGLLFSSRPEPVLRQPVPSEPVVHAEGKSAQEVAPEVIRSVRAAAKVNCESLVRLPTSFSAQYLSSGFSFGRRSDPVDVQTDASLAAP